MRLVVDSLCVSYGDKRVLKGVCAGFDTDNVYLVVGMNGSGKTTLFNAVNELISADSGRVFIEDSQSDGMRSDGMRSEDSAGSGSGSSVLCSLGDAGFKKRLFYVPSDFYLPEYMSGVEYLRFVLKWYPSASFELASVLCRVLDMNAAARKRIESYSFGMKKKIQIIAAIASNADFVLADELFSGLDFETVLLLQEIIETVRKNRCFVLVTHDAGTVQRYPGFVSVMRDGLLERFEGSSAGLLDYMRRAGDIDGKVRQVERYAVSL